MKKFIVCHDLEKKEFQVETDKLIFRPSVYGVLIDGEKILLSKQWDGYDIPGGGVNIEETVEEALAREFFEETGINVEIIAPIYCSTSFFHPSHSPKRNHEYWNCPLMYFLVKKVGGEISAENFDDEEKEYAALAEWISLNEVTGLKYYNSVDSPMVIRKAREYLRRDALLAS